MHLANESASCAHVKMEGTSKKDRLPMKTLTVLGSTGSIGTHSLDVLRRNRESYAVYALVAGRNTEQLATQIAEFRPAVAVVATEAVRSRLCEQLTAINLPKTCWPELSWGRPAMIAAATSPQVDVVISAIVGVAGLEATFEAVCKGKRVGLANKEVLVAAGRLVMDAVSRYGAELLPIDSEHNGAHQCLRAGKPEEVHKLILTASGGASHEDKNMPDPTAW